MKSPYLQLKEAIFDINRMAYETDDYFKECEAQLEHNIKIRDHLVTGLDLNTTDEQRKELQKGIYNLDFVIERIKEELRLYLDDYLKEYCVEKEVEDEEKLNAAFERAQIANERIYLIQKHKRPELVEEFLKITFAAFTSDEIEEFWRNTRKRETDELDEILESVAAEATSLRP